MSLCNCLRTPRASGSCGNGDTDLNANVRQLEQLRKLDGPAAMSVVADLKVLLILTEVPSLCVFALDGAFTLNRAQQLNKRQ